MLTLVKYPDPILRKRAREITDEEFASGYASGYDMDRLLKDMSSVMDQYGGVGLAGPQVGIGLRVWIARASGELQIIFNPTICSSDGSDNFVEEGCLSLPGVMASVPRATKISVSGRNSKGTPIVLNGEGVSAAVYQHETDHLDGRLIVDYVDAGFREIIAREIGLSHDDDSLASFIKHRQRIAWKMGADECCLHLNPLYVEARHPGGISRINLSKEKKKGRRKQKKGGANKRKKR